MYHSCNRDFLVCSVLNIYYLALSGTSWLIPARRVYILLWYHLKNIWVTLVFFASLCILFCTFKNIMQKRAPWASPDCQNHDTREKKKGQKIQQWGISGKMVGPVCPLTESLVPCLCLADVPYFWSPVRKLPLLSEWYIETSPCARQRLY